jgi:Tfp pilus assembly protein PilE
MSDTETCGIIKDHCTTGSGGVTVLELTVAVVLTSILVSVVYFSWNQLTHQTTVLKRKTALHTECNRISRMITDRLRGTQSVLKWNTDYIEFVPASKKDTCSISFRGSSLSINDTPVKLLLPGTEISMFAIENLNGYDQSRPYLFRLSFQLVNIHGDTAHVENSLMIRRTSEPGTDDFLW